MPCAPLMRVLDLRSPVLQGKPPVAELVQFHREGNSMKTFLVKCLTVFPIALGLLVPLGTVSAAAEDHDRDRDRDRDQRYYDRNRDQRYYDRDYRDYHQWNANEDRAYHRYWEERRHPYTNWDR